MERALEPPIVAAKTRDANWSLGAAFVVMVVVFAVGPFVVYPVFLMKALCFALFACAFNLLIGYGGLASFGHALVLRLGELRHSLHRQDLGLAAGVRPRRRHGDRRGARRRCRRSRHPPPGHLFRHDHAWRCRR